MRKISIVGAGNVGATCAFILALKNINLISLIDVVEGLAEGKALDIMQSSPVLEFETTVRGFSDFVALADSELVIITAGLPRKPGMSRQDLVKKNAQIVKQVAGEIREKAPSSKIIMVTNPLDVMTYLAFKVSEFPSNRVFGMAGILDGARYRYFVSEMAKVNPKEVEATIIGSHADEMVVLERLSKIDEQPAENFLSPSELTTIKDRTRKAGAEIVSLLKTGSAYFAPAAAAAFLAEAVLFDKKVTVPVSAYLDGQYGFSDIYVGVPALVGKNGVEMILELELNQAERKDLEISVESIKEAVQSIEGI